jgi:SAM-dependent methyltransferase
MLVGTSKSKDVLSPMNRLTKVALLATAAYTARTMRLSARRARAELSASQRNLRESIEGYDRNMPDGVKALYFGNTGFYNFGYWTPGIEEQGRASEDLVNKLLGWIPEKKGRILDVACGMGASTKMLLDHYDARNVTAINFSGAQLHLAARRAPDAAFAQMDAARLAFPNNAFDAVICVEAAFHFDTRNDFLREALRVLKPGGYLVMTDILGRIAYPVAANFLKNPAAYAENLATAGFEAIHVDNATTDSWFGFARHAVPWSWKAWRSGLCGPLDAARFFVYVLGFVAGTGAYLRYYTHSVARKPL